MADAENDHDDDAGQDGSRADPRAKLMQEVAAQMDAIETDYGDDYEIRRVITIVEVTRPNGEVDVRVRAGMYPWVALGMLDWARKSMEAQVTGGGSDA